MRTHSSPRPQCAHVSPTPPPPATLPSCLRSMPCPLHNVCTFPRHAQALWSLPGCSGWAPVRGQREGGVAAPVPVGASVARRSPRGANAGLRWEQVRTDRHTSLRCLQSVCEIRKRGEGGGPSSQCNSRRVGRGDCREGMGTRGAGAHERRPPSLGLAGLGPSALLPGRGDRMCFSKLLRGNTDSLSCCPRRWKAE